MTRHVVTACSLVLILFGLGYLVRGCWFAKQPASQPRALAAAPATLATPSPTRASAPRAIVTVSSGLVELRNAASRAWQPLGVNQELRSNDALRTSKGARAEVAMGTAVRVEVAEQSEVSLSSATDDGSRLRLDNGRIAAHVDSSNSQGLQVDVRDNPAIAQSRQGEFSMLRRSDGQVTVATTQGSVELRSHEQAVRVDAGQQSIVPVDRAPSAPKPIPASLFLKIVRVGAAQTNRRETELGGTTSPGAVVTVNGMAISADGEGHFNTKVPLREGKNSVVVTAQDAMGRKKQQTLAPIHVDTQAPKLGGEVRW